MEYNQFEYQYITWESVMDYYALNLDLEGKFWDFNKLENDAWKQFGCAKKSFVGVLRIK